MSREQILAILETHRGTPVSGPRLATSLHLSRSAVWKAVNVLRKEGHTIHTLGREGYLLDPKSDGLSKEGIVSAYVASGGLDGPLLQRALEIHQSLPSTNTYLKEKAALEEKLQVVLANRQTSGRGRMGRTFHSEDAGGLYLSILLPPPEESLNTDLLTIAAALVVAETLDALYGIKTGVKWVNDVFHEGRKVAGILTEGTMEMESGRLSYVILGIGININSTALPEDLRPIAASLLETTGKKLLRSTVAGTLLAALERTLEGTRKDPFSLLSRYREKLLYLNQPISVFQGQKRMDGILVGVNDQGELLLQEEDRLTVHRSGEVRIRSAKGGFLHE